MRRNERGYRVGQDHHRAKLTDAQVEAMRRIYETWKAEGSDAGYGTLGRMFGCSMWTCREIVQFKSRTY